MTNIKEDKKTGNGKHKNYDKPEIHRLSIIKSVELKMGTSARLLLICIGLGCLPFRFGVIGGRTDSNTWLLYVYTETHTLSVLKAIFLLNLG